MQGFFCLKYQYLLIYRVPETRKLIPETRSYATRYYPILLATRKIPEGYYPIPENLLPEYPLIVIFILQKCFKQCVLAAKAEVTLSLQLSITNISNY